MQNSYKILTVILFYLSSINLYADDTNKIELDAVTSASRLANYPVEIKDIFSYDAFMADPTKQKETYVSYNLSRKAHVRVRIVHRENNEIILRTLVNWSPRAIGKNIEIWDFKDGSGNLTDNKKVLFLFNVDSNYHKEHIPEKCHDFSVKIIEPSLETTPILTEKFNLKFIVEPGKTDYSDKFGYRARIYIDNKFLAEKSYSSEISQPFAFHLDSNSQKNGYHTLTINIDDYFDHFGTATAKMKFTN